MSEKSKRIELMSVKLPSPQAIFLKIEAAKSRKTISKLLSDAVLKVYKVDQNGFAVK